MNSQEKRILFQVLTGLLCCAVLAAGVLFSVSYFTRGQNLRPVDMRKYAKVEMEDEVYTVYVDADAIIRDFHLPNPKTTNLDVSRYPDVEAVYSLSFLVTPQQEGWLIQTGSDRPDPAGDLKKGGLKLVNTEWQWTEADMKAVYRESLEYPRKLSMKKYVLCGKNTMGGYVLTVDHERMIRACGWDLPADETERKAHSGYRAIMSLGYYVTPLTEGFLVETSSTIENVYSQLLENGVRLTDTTWTYTLGEVEAMYVEQHAQELSASPVPEETPAPEQAAPAESPSTGEGTGDSLSDDGKSKLSEGEQALTSLYHVDQTPVRQAIQKAKEQKYGKSFKSSQIAANYFIVAKDPGATFQNCFRVVYTITTANGKEYLTADVYNLSADSKPTAGDVTLTVKKSAAAAAATDEFSTSLYTVYTLEGGSMAYAEDSGASPFTSDGLLFPDSLTRRITSAEVWSLSIPNDKNLLQLLGYGRNEIFARCGNKFSDTSVYTKFYSNYSWYHPKGSVSYNSIKKKYPTGCENIDYIKSLEKLIKEG